MTGGNPSGPDDKLLFSFLIALVTDAGVNSQYYGILGLGLVLLGRRRRIIIGYRVGYTLDLHKARFKTTSHNDT